MFYLPVCVSRELNLYADVSLYVLLRRLNKRAERCTKRGTLITLIQQTAFRRCSAYCAESDAKRCADNGTTDGHCKWRSSFKRSLSGVVLCKIKCLFGRLGGKLCLRLQGLNLVQLDAVVIGRRTYVLYCTQERCHDCAPSGVCTTGLVPSQYECPPKRRNTSYRIEQQERPLSEQHPP